jgi:hypothetical protein
MHRLLAILRRECRFQVVAPDPHNFDGDFDRIGCEGG